MRSSIVLAALALALTACGSGGAEVAAPSSSSVAMSQEERSREFAKCMRDNGVDVPDPEPGGKPGGFGKVDRTDPDFERATDACREFLPGGGDLSKLDPAKLDQLRVFAQCMRDNGIDVPDPDPNGGKLTGLGQLDRNTPAFRSALDVCRDKLPELGR
ncbi:hypothetical protein ADK67_16010 [Saccharothrix sp. NRRL B-16348]|uniref:hypothetical protein n=1 Tax=Saccharothrix sp. NRRL B-16348 TaxID=1415542 RepID=UPI0006AF5CDF|nr:hypothetical protein [Saccharothrix sp. NRRL B-16348]KOX26506.1 hypothetical protein ADK67_16010 [Saccharothrix sp. NRRL B-16348]